VLVETVLVRLWCRFLRVSEYGEQQLPRFLERGAVDLRYTRRRNLSAYLGAHVTDACFK